MTYSTVLRWRWNAIPKVVGIYSSPEAAAKAVEAAQRGPTGWAYSYIVQSFVLDQEISNAQA